MNNLAHQLPDIVKNSRAVSTTKQYAYSFKNWTSWCCKYQKSPLPADPYAIALYLTELGNRANSPSPINNAIAGISWAHKMANVDIDPTQAQIVKNTHHGWKRILSKPVSKKEPISADQIQVMVSLYGSDKTAHNLMNIRTLCMILISYAGFLRFDELVNIKLSHLSFNDSFLEILIPRSKTDQYRQGNSVLIARTNSSMCPVSMMELYLRLIDSDSLDKSSFIFRNFSKTKKGYVFRSVNIPMSYSRVREIILQAFKPVVGDVSSYCLHSLRAGGASAAANSGIEDRLFKCHGRWKTESAKDGYVKDSVSRKLSVSKSLGL